MICQCIHRSMVTYQISIWVRLILTPSGILDHSLFGQFGSNQMYIYWGNFIRQNSRCVNGPTQLSNTLQELYRATINKVLSLLLLLIRDGPLFCWMGGWIRETNSPPPPNNFFYLINSKSVRLFIFSDMSPPPLTAAWCLAHVHFNK